MEIKIKIKTVKWKPGRLMLNRIIGGEVSVCGYDLGAYFGLCVWGKGLVVELLVGHRTIFFEIGGRGESKD